MTDAARAGQPRAQLSFVRLLLRYSTKLALGGVSRVCIAFSSRRQALHDRWFGTLVWHAPGSCEIPAPAEPPRDPALP